VKLSSVMKYIRQTITCIVFALLLYPLNAQGPYKDALKAFDYYNYPTAIKLFEQALQGDSKLSESERLNAKTKLAFSYKQTKDTKNAERIYQELVESSSKSLTGEHAKVYLYYAQALASNGKYKDSEKIYEQYTKLAAATPATTSKINQDAATSLKSSSAKAVYNIEYLNVNSTALDFSPTYYKNGLVFCSSRNKSSLLDLFYVPNLNNIQQVKIGNESVNGDVFSNTYMGTAAVGRDEYTPPTANDSKTLGFAKSFDNSPKVSNKGKITSESEQFSKTLNTRFNEGPCTFTNDASRIIFTRNNYNGGVQGYSEDKVTKIKLYTSRQTNGNWDEPTELPFNSEEFSTGHPSLTRDNRLMYFTSDMPGGRGGMDIYVVSYDNGNWGKPINLGPSVNTPENDVFPFVDDNGNLYFSTGGRKGGLGGLDLYFVEIKNGKATGQAVNLGSPINSTADDFGILTDGDRRTGYFTSNRKGKGDDDIYRFGREGTVYACRELTINAIDADERKGLSATNIIVESKGKTENKITNASGELKICLEQNKDYTFRIEKDGFRSSMTGFSTRGLADNEPSRIEVALEKTTEAPSQEIVMENPTIKSKDSQRVTTQVTVPSEEVSEVAKNKNAKIKGTIKDSDGKGMPNVLVKVETECDKEIQSMITDQEGRYSFFLKDDCDYTLMVDSSGTLAVEGIRKPEITSVSEKIIRSSSRNGEGRKPSLIVKDITVFKLGDVLSNQSIYYDKNRMLSDDFTTEIDRLVAILQRYPNMTIELGLYTDSRGTSENNLQVTERRAKEVADYLVTRGVNRERILAKGYGESSLVNNCGDGVRCTEVEHQQNRRMTVKIMKVR
jgi:outer membrane protein OmpA-like peptidoglycan-associated protein